MELKGNLNDIMVDYRRHKTLICFAVDNPPAEIEEAFEGLKEKELVLKINQYSPKRSLNANAYFHALCREIGQKIDRSDVFVKNRMIATSGQPDLNDNGEAWSIKTNLDVEKMWEQETLHVRPIGTKVENGKTLYFYAVMRPSHTYTRKEMSQLIDSTVEECKHLGIPTISDKDMEKMLNAWGK
jgi:hypothetical protein